MSINEIFGIELRRFREAAGLSQDELAHKAGLDRSFIGQLERGLKSPTLQTVEKISNVLGVTPSQLVRSNMRPAEADLPAAHAYFVSRHRNLAIARNPAPDKSVSTRSIMLAIDVAHGLIDELYAYDLDIAQILGLRNLSAFVGELLAAAILRVTGDDFQSNPHQDGYPDLLLMDQIGLREWKRLEKSGLLTSKLPFSPFLGSGLEIKATCGSIPTPAASLRKKSIRPATGDRRIDVLTGYDWKAHHRDTNNLLGLLWDFAGRRPRISALFYSNQLTVEDWSVIVQPKAGGGRTTSVSIMRPSGIRKMYEGWICVLKVGGYAEFLNRKNGNNLISEIKH